MTRLRRFLAALWRPIRENARKLIPSRSVRWTVLYVPGFTLGLLFALKTFGGMDDLFAYVMEAGTRSVPVLIGIAITYGVATGLEWNLNNDFRAELQEELRAYTDAPAGKWPLTPAQFGAFLILAGEMVSILSLLALFIAALIVWQG